MNAHEQLGHDILNTIHRAVKDIADQNIAPTKGENCYQEMAPMRTVGLPPAPSASANEHISNLLGELDSLHDAAQSLVEAISPVLLIQPETGAAGAHPTAQSSPLIGRLEVARAMTRQVTEILQAARNRVAL